MRCDDVTSTWLGFLYHFLVTTSLSNRPILYYSSSPSGHFLFRLAKAESRVLALYYALKKHTAHLQKNITKKPARLDETLIISKFHPSTSVSIKTAQLLITEAREKDKCAVKICRLVEENGSDSG